MSFVLSSVQAASQIHHWAEALHQDLPNQSPHCMLCARFISSLCLAFQKVFIVAVCKTRVHAGNREKNILLIAVAKAFWYKDLKSFTSTGVAFQQPSSPHGSASDGLLQTSVRLRPPARLHR